MHPPNHGKGISKVKAEPERPGSRMRMWESVIPCPVSACFLRAGHLSPAQVCGWGRDEVPSTSMPQGCQKYHPSLPTPCEGRTKGTEVGTQQRTWMRPPRGQPSEETLRVGVHSV